VLQLNADRLCQQARAPVWPMLSRLYSSPCRLWSRRRALRPHKALAGGLDIANRKHAASRQRRHPHDDTLIERGHRRAVPTQCRDNRRSRQHLNFAARKHPPIFQRLNHHQQTPLMVAEMVQRPLPVSQRRKLKLRPTAAPLVINSFSQMA
jgi:hypothetical protein